MEEREEEKHPSAAPRMCPNWGLDLQPRHVLQQGIELANLLLCRTKTNQLGHTGQDYFSVCSKLTALGY